MVVVDNTSGDPATRAVVGSHGARCVAEPVRGLTHRPSPDRGRSPCLREIVGERSMHTEKPTMHSIAARVQSPSEGLDDAYLCCASPGCGSDDMHDFDRRSRELLGHRLGLKGTHTGAR